MRNLALFFLLFTIVVLSRFVADVPLAIWCGEGYLRDRNIAVSNTVSIGDVENLMRSFVATSSVQEGVLSQYLSPNLHPEVVVVFAERKIRSDQLSIHKNSFTNLRNLIQTEKSSLVAPFVDLSVSFDNTIINMAHTTQGKVFYVGKGSTLLQDLKTQKSALTVVSQKLEETVPDSVFSNGVADLIVVYLDSFFTDLDNKFKESDATIKNVQSFISSKTTKYVGVYIGLEYDEPHLTSKFVGSEMPVSKHEKRYFLQMSNVTATVNATVPLFRQFFGGWFWELFLVCIILVPLLTVGMFAINGIQTPIFPKSIDKKHHAK